METLINDAADMMAKYDAGAAHIFREQPFRRLMIAGAFRHGFKTHSPQTLELCSILDRVAAVDLSMRLLSGGELANGSRYHLSGNHRACR